jgi:hypothetical protein
MWFPAYEIFPLLVLSHMAICLVPHASDSETEIALPELPTLRTASATVGHVDLDTTNCYARLISRRNAKLSKSWDHQKNRHAGGAMPI